MKINIREIIESKFLKGLFSLFGRTGEPVCKTDPAATITKEIDGLWEMVRQGDGVYDSETEPQEMIAKSFAKVKALFSNDILDSVYTWPRYVKVAVHCVEEPINELIDYVNEDNYIRLTKRLSDLSHSVHKGEENQVKVNMDKFSEAVYLHILQSIDPVDIPSCLALGRMHQKRSEYDVAKKWFEKITETDNFFNGVTALLSCYEEEVKSILFSNKNKSLHDSELGAKVKSLNEQQCSIYEKWCAIAEERINNEDGTQEQIKKEFVSLVTGYARFERNRGNYKKAFELLSRVPDSYPEVYRVYAEEAMIYQFKPYKNDYYSLEKAIEFFEKAENAINAGEKTDNYGPKSKKSVLVPLANTYFQAGKYEEAGSVCDRVLRIDDMEQRAIDLKNRIARLVA